MLYAFAAIITVSGSIGLYSAFSPRAMRPATSIAEIVCLLALAALSGYIFAVALPGSLPV
jgi:hypothetical protein